MAKALMLQGIVGWMPTCNVSVDEGLQWSLCDLRSSFNALGRLSAADWPLCRRPVVEPTGRLDMLW